MRAYSRLLLLLLLLPSAARAGYNAASGAWDFNGTCTPATSCTVGDVLTVTDTGHAIFQAPSGGGLGRYHDGGQLCDGRGVHRCGELRQRAQLRGRHRQCE